MTKKQEIKLLWQCTMGKESHLNILGKIILAPIIICIGLLITILILLFTKSKEL